MSAATTTTLGPAIPLAALSYIPEGPPPWAPRPELAEAQAALTDDGDVFDLGNGWSLRLSIEVDEDNPHTCIDPAAAERRCLACEAQWIALPFPTPTNEETCR